MIAATPFPRPAERLRAAAAALAPAGLALLLTSVALLAGWRGVDQAAQTYRTVMYQLHGLMLWDSGWYAGNFPLGYSVLFPPVAAVFGMKVVAVASAVVATWSFDRFVRSYLGARPLGTWYFAVSTVLPVTIGQWPFLAGEAAGLLALVALQRGRRPAAIALGIIAALFSPLAAAFLAMGCLAWAAYNTGRRRWCFATAIIAMAVVLGLGLLFPGTGPFPFPWTGLVATELLCLTALTPLVRTTPAVRLGALFYAVASFFSFVVPNPLGGNAPRLAASIGVPLLACFLTAPGPQLSRLSHAVLVRRVLEGRNRAWAARLVPSGRWRYGAALLVVPFAVWQWAPSERIVASPGTTPYNQASFYAPLVSTLHRLHPAPLRLEIVPTFDHWESAFVAPVIPLARGWERQLDVGDNPLFYQPGALTAASYSQWLQDEGISYVALPAAPLDYAGSPEAALLRSGSVRGLDLVWSSKQWRLWKVTAGPGLVSGPATLTSLEPDHFTLQFSRPGLVTVRVRYTKFWSVSSGTACVLPGQAVTHPGIDSYQWTEVDALHAGTVELSATMLPQTPLATCPQPG